MDGHHHVGGQHRQGLGHQVTQTIRTNAMHMHFGV